MLISVLRGLVLIIPTLYIMMNALGVTGVWVTMPIVEVLTLLLVVLIFIFYRFRLRRY